MADYGRRSRRGGDGGGAADALAQLAACRRRKEEGGAEEGSMVGKRRIDTFKVRPLPSHSAPISANKTQAGTSELVSRSLDSSQGMNQASVPCV